MSNRDAFLELDGVTVRYGKLIAVDDVALEVAERETLGLVGESGCGKTSLAKALVGLVPMARGTAKLAGSDFAARRAGDPTWIARNIQLLFQDPIASLSPRMTVAELLNEPFIVRGVAMRERSAVTNELAARLGLPPDIFARYPHQLSGGQARRVSLMRALGDGTPLAHCR